ncbi:MAG: hypothetical protein H7061_11870 [Bdellovibrionaceae bacterium]|nr:hypothetical protein [Bdellovibrio sp.]
MKLNPFQHAFSKEDHLKYGFTHQFLREAPNSIFCIGLGHMDSVVNDFFNECKLSALDIFNRSENKKLFVCLSGGVDSECVARSFVGAKVPIEAVILKFNANLNWHDVDPAVQLCEQIGLKYTLVELDIFDFLESRKYQNYCLSYGLSSPMIASHVWLAEQVISKMNGVPIFSGDFARIRRPSNYLIRQLSDTCEIVGDFCALPSEWTFASLANQDHFAIDRLFAKLGCPGVANFFLYSAEQIASSIALGFSHDFIRFEQTLVSSLTSALPRSAVDFYEGQKGLNKIKEQFFRFAGFTVNSRASKWTGFELVHDLLGTDQRLDGRQLSPLNNSEEKIIGMTLFNEKYRRPMEQAIQQIHLKEILLKPSLYQFIKNTLFQSLQGP